ncbi:MAG: phage protein Gp36 family protein [Thermodesulfobacteriota bacterium]|nr:phage protein Gp36 family protein [Thermodesulfobacteriota bacterium]
MAFCERAELEDYVLAAYLDKADEINPGCVARHIDQVGEEIEGALLQGGYDLPLPSVPGKVTHINAVISAYRSIGNITSLMASEGSTGNEWIPLQTQYKEALKTLAAIREGKVMLFPEDAGGDVAPDDDAIMVEAPEKIWTDDVLSRF